ncbi:MAG: hypothetical protein HKN91_11255 [Acidimicrobiia bacterium]|nr:hypothetical protein [Acidimicrobiia bacterium]
MTGEDSLEFNIIYTPGTVRYLSFFVQSLLEWSDASYRLVSNGCGADEMTQLRQLCDQDRRLRFLAIPTRRVMEHGRALNYLQASTDSDHFCFLDSDIFATGEFLGVIESKLCSHRGVFSGSPIWVKSSDEVMPSDFQGVQGHFNRTDTGVCLGVTYLAVYDNQLLTSVMQSTGIGFEEHLFSELPPLVQVRLATHDLNRFRYDTAKVLNILLSTSGEDLTYVDIPELCHIGGTSFAIASGRRPASVKRRIGQSLDSPWTRPLIEAYTRRRALQAYRKRYQHGPEAEFAMNSRQRLLHRNPVRQHFVHLVDALHNGHRLPTAPEIGDQEIAGNLQLAAEQYLDVYEKYGTQSGPA